METPSITTDKLALDPPDQSGFDAYAAFFTDEDASANYGGPISNAQTWNWLKSDLESWHLSGFGVWMIRNNNGRRGRDLRFLAGVRQAETTAVVVAAAS